MTSWFVLCALLAVLVAEKAAEKKSTAKGMKAVQSKVEKSTLGDIDALAELKDKLDKTE